MKKAILKGNLAAICLSLCCALLLSAFMFNYRMTQKTQKDLATIAQVSALLLQNEEDAQSVAAQLAKNTGLRVTIISESGQVLADTEKQPEELANHLNRKEIEQAQKTGSGVAVHNSDSLGEKLVYAAAKTADGSFLRISASYNSLVWDLLAFWPMLAIGLGVGLAAAIPLAKRQSAVVTAPIAQLSREVLHLNCTIIHIRS